MANTAVLGPTERGEIAYALLGYLIVQEGIRLKPYSLNRRCAELAPKIGVEQERLLLFARGLARQAIESAFKAPDHEAEKRSE